MATRIKKEFDCFWKGLREIVRFCDPIRMSIFKGMKHVCDDETFWGAHLDGLKPDEEVRAIAEASFATLRKADRRIGEACSSLLTGADTFFYKTRGGLMVTWEKVEEGWLFVLVRPSEAGYDLVFEKSPARGWSPIK